MRKFFILVGVCLGLSTFSFASSDVRESLATSVAIGNVAVSTETATAIKVGSSNLAGRTALIIQNVDAFSIFIGTHTGVTVSDGYEITSSTIPAVNQIRLPVGSGVTIYGLGQSQSTSATIDIRVIELKQ